MRIWNSIFKLGVFGFLVVVILGFVTIGTYWLGIDGSQLAEGGELSRYARVGGFWLFLLAGIALIIPSLASLSRSAGEMSAVARISWTLFILAFFFAGPYLYFALYCRPQSQE